MDTETSAFLLRLSALATLAEIKEQERQERIRARKLRILKFARAALPAVLSVASVFLGSRIRQSHNPTSLGPRDVLFRNVSNVWRCSNGRFIIDP